MKRLLSGIQPSGELTIGNYIGAIKNFVEMQNEYESFVFIADMHSITLPQDPKELQEKIRRLIGIYLACGLDPKHTSLFIQSENKYHANLSWVLECNTYIGELNRMTQFKDKSKDKKDDGISCGLYTYPTLMAADILIYDADVVPTGIDQKQHVELTRDIAIRFNKKYGETLKVPVPIIPKMGAKIMDLIDPTKKMSKSSPIEHKGSIRLLDDPEVARKKIMGAVTDSEAKVFYDEQNKPGISNLMTIYSSLTNKNYEDIEKEFENQNYGAFKTAVADIVVGFLRDLQDKYNNIINSNVIDSALDEGLAKVENIAKTKVEDVFKKIGLGRSKEA